MAVDRSEALWLAAALLAGSIAGITRLPSPPAVAFQAARSELRPSLVPVQSKSPKALGAGKVLVAGRNLPDENFAETVILLAHYDQQSVVGLMLNRRTDVPLSRVLKTLAAAKLRSDPVYLGGPVEESVVLALRRSESKLEGAERVFGDLYLISSKALLEKTIAEGVEPGDFHLYLGYAGWTNQQLQMEVEAGAWYIFPADAGMIFDANPDSLWTRLIRKTEEKIAGNFRLRNLPAMFSTPTSLAL
jgi:putative transcriptional regulator